MTTFISDISKKSFPISEKIVGTSIRNNMMVVIKKDYPDFSENSLLSAEEFNEYRKKYITDLLKKQIGNLTELETPVLTALHERSTLSDKIDDDDMNLSSSQKLADMVASFGGSWKFIVSFGVFILIWIILNVFMLINSSFDPYPFILLNLILSCIAALQAPIIMMSQNRQEEKDRDRSKKDYMINLKSELEIRLLHEKIDHLIMNQQQDLFEIQQAQFEIINEILKQVTKK